MPVIAQARVQLRQGRAIGGLGRVQAAQRVARLVGREEAPDFGQDPPEVGIQRGEVRRGRGGRLREQVGDGDAQAAGQEFQRFQRRAGDAPFEGGHVALSEFGLRHAVLGQAALLARLAEPRAQAGQGTIGRFGAPLDRGRPRVRGGPGLGGVSILASFRDRALRRTKWPFSPVPPGHNTKTMYTPTAGKEL